VTAGTPSRTKREFPVELPFDIKICTLFSKLRL
jgi:hypothetical protein